MPVPIYAQAIFESIDFAETTAQKRRHPHPLPARSGSAKKLSAMACAPAGSGTSSTDSSPSVEATPGVAWQRGSSFFGGCPVWVLKGSSYRFKGKQKNGHQFRGPQVGDKASGWLREAFPGKVGTDLFAAGFNGVFELLLNRKVVGSN